MQDLNVAIIQTTLRWKSPAENMKHFESYFEHLDSPSLVVLPETFTTGFAVDDPEAAQAYQEETLDWMKKLAQQYSTCIAGSIFYVDDTNPFNRFVWMDPDVGASFYDKAHLFSHGGEDEKIIAGSRIVEFRQGGWTLRPAVCYDLRFPAWLRNTSGYDVLILVANWPKVRRHHWRVLTQARAIENQSYVVAVNRIGADPNFECGGHSLVIGPDGSILCDAGEADGVFTATLSKQALDEYRETLPFLRDADTFVFS